MKKLIPAILGGLLIALVLITKPLSIALTLGIVFIIVYIYYEYYK